MLVHVLTLECVALGQVVIVGLSQDPGLHSSNQTLQVAMIHVEAELLHGAKWPISRRAAVQVSVSPTATSVFLLL